MFRIILILTLLCGLSNCGFQTVYGDHKQEELGGFSYEEELASIRIKKNRTKIDQDLKNHLYDLLNPQYLKVEPKYFLILTTKETVRSTFITETGASGRNKVYFYVNYELRDLKTAETIATGKTSVNDNYDVTTNRFGTYTAEEYVKSNLTKIAAQNLRNSLINDLTEMKRREEESENKTEE